MTWYINATPSRNTKLMNTIRVEFTDENELIFRKSILIKHDYIENIVRSRDIFTIFTLHVFIHDWMVYHMKIKGGTYHLDINNRMLMSIYNAWNIDGINTAIKENEYLSSMSSDEKIKFLEGVNSNGDYEDSDSMVKS